MEPSSNRRVSSKGIYILYFISLFLIYLLGFSLVQGKSAEIEWSLLSVVLPAAEIIIACASGLLFWPLKNTRIGFLAKPVILLIPVALTIIYLSQLYSIYLSGTYISDLALDNASEIQYVMRPAVIVTAMVLVCLWVLLGVSLYWHDSSSMRLREMWLPALLAIWGLGASAGVYLPKQESGASDRSVYFAPATALGRVLEKRFEHEREIRKIFKRFERGEIPQVFPYNTGEKYPFQKSDFENVELPFPERNPIERQNVIVIFAEGFSARFMASYGGAYTDLTPNLNQVAEKMMQVNNYYNHTAATYAGLKGQLSSVYTHISRRGVDGWEEKGKNNTPKLSRLSYQSVANVLNQHGYDTVFFSPHSDQISFNTFIKSIKFRSLYSYENMEELTGRIPDGRIGGKDCIEDEDVFDGLVGFLERRLEEQSTDPFFVATYNIGTHAFRNVSKGQATYGDASNKVLNRMHHFDRVMGKFFDYFFQSPYAENTLLIFTADHATFPEPAHVQAFEDAGRHFIDEVPLLIYSPVLELPDEYDANFRNSLDFAPTLMNLLGISGFSHAWLGHSIFDKRYDQGFSIAAIRNEFFRIDKRGVEPLPPNDDYSNMISAFYMLETNNRVFSENHSN